MVETWRSGLMENEFKELEYKYNADEIKLTDFKKLIKTMQHKQLLEVSSWDVYYTKENDKEEFQRFRNSTTNPELTKKRKVKNSNNWERIESDLPLDPKRITEEKVSFHVGLDGYKENFRIYKSCTIYWLDLVNFVYYIVYNENMKEVGRFVEVEINKDQVQKLGGEEKAFEVLKEYEQKLLPLGISPQNRLKKSLFEMFVK